MKKILAVLFALFTFLAIGCGDTADESGAGGQEETAALDLNRPVHPPEAFAGSASSSHFSHVRGKITR